MALSTNIKPD